MPTLNDDVLRRTPAKRWGMPGDFEGIAAFLASDAANQGRDDLDAQAMRNAQVSVVHPPSDRRWKAGVVLGVDR
jgi:NAD(P)-dependent dehydrogenase (short-subunit alcohol dehydrogenase family)